MSDSTENLTKSSSKIILWIIGIIFFLVFLFVIIGIPLLCHYKWHCFRKKTTPKPFTPIVPPSKPEYITYQGFNIPTVQAMANMPLTNITTEADCQNQCTSTTGCDFYIFQPSTNQCTLKTIQSQTGSDTGIKIIAGQPYYIKQNTNIDGTNYILTPQQASVTAMPIPNSTDLSCAKACDSASACQWYNLVGSDCYLKAGNTATGYNLGFAHTPGLI